MKSEKEIRKKLEELENLDVPLNKYGGIDYKQFGETVSKINILYWILEDNEKSLDK